jgi:primosomal protein N' (replication factor Y)
VIGTSLLSVPPKDISFDLVIVMNADSSLHVPDFQSNRNCFNALYTSIQKHTAPIFLVQSYAPDHNALQYACQQDVSSMQTHELQWRKTNDYPPYTQMCVLLYKHEIEKRLYGSTNKLYQELLFLQEQYELKDIQIYTTPPLVYKVR